MVETIRKTDDTKLCLIFVRLARSRPRHIWQFCHKAFEAVLGSLKDNPERRAQYLK